MRLTFQLVADTGKTKTFGVLNGATFLGSVKWYAPWRRYCFFPGNSALFDSSCLKEITGFIDARMEERKSA